MSADRCQPWFAAPRAPTPAEAIAEQRRLAVQVIASGDTENVRWIAGLDAAFSPDGEFCVGAVVLWDRRTAETLERQVAWCPVTFPYIPGLLSFREVPTLLAALDRLRLRPDLLLCDGQGLAHPRRFGLACHLGILTDLPAIGCAKSLLIGQHDPLGRPKGSRVALTHAGQQIGEVVRTREGVRPVYVSVGHRVALQDAVGLVLSCAVRFRLPEPTRLADALAGIARRRGSDWTP